MRFTSIVVVAALVGSNQAMKLRNLNSNTIDTRSSAMTLVDCEQEYKRTGQVLAECQQYLHNGQAQTGMAQAAPAAPAQAAPIQAAAQAAPVAQAAPLAPTQAAQAPAEIPTAAPATKLAAQPAPDASSDDDCENTCCKCDPDEVEKVFTNLFKDMFVKKDKEVKDKEVIDAVKDATDEPVKKDGDKVVVDDKTVTKETTDKIKDVV
jgi:hypothetical protein